MNGSGIEEVWATIYAKNSIVHMMSGHSYARALRAHILTYLALTIPVSKSIDFEISGDEDILIENLSHFSFDLLADFLPLKNKIREKIIEKFEALASASDTAKLWLQYYKLVELALMFIRSERRGDISLQMYCCKEMLP